VKLTAWTVLAVAIVASAASGQTTLPANSPEAPAIRDAARPFVTAIVTGDLNGLRQRWAGTDADRQFIEAFFHMIQARKNIYAAMQKKWPGTADPFGPPPESFIKHVDTNSITTTGDTATIKGMCTLRKINGQWKVVDYGTAAEKKQEQFVRHLTQVANDLRRSEGVGPGADDRTAKPAAIALIAAFRTGETSAGSEAPSIMWAWTSSPPSPARPARCMPSGSSRAPWPRA
jgi:hypothetical protein